MVKSISLKRYKAIREKTKKNEKGIEMRNAVNLNEDVYTLSPTYAIGLQSKQFVYDKNFGFQHLDHIHENIHVRIAFKSSGTGGQDTIKSVGFARALLAQVIVSGSIRYDYDDEVAQELISAIEANVNDVSAAKKVKQLLEHFNYELEVVLPVANLTTVVDEQHNKNKWYPIKSVEVIEEETIEETAEEITAIETLNSDYFIPDDFALAFQLAQHTVKNGSHLNIIMKGPSGEGKTAFFDAIADEAEVDVFHMNCATVLDPEKWFGKTQLKDGETFFEKTKFTEVVEKGHVVILLDEINRVAAEIANSLLPLLDYRRKTTVGNYDIVCGEGIVFGMTANIGFQYTGTDQIDVALKNRNLITLQVKRKPKNVELQIIKRKYPDIDDDGITFIVDICNAIRDVVEEILEEEGFVDIDVSTRTALGMAEMIYMLTAAELPVDKAQILNYTIFNSVETAQALIIIDKLQTQGLLK